MDLSSLPKIKRIVKPPLPKESEHLVKSTKVSFSTTLLSNSDYKNIFKNCTILFIGDNSIRTLFRDLCKALQTGRLLDFTEVSRQNGCYVPIQNETILLSEGKVGSDSYRDVHQFILKDLDLKIFYIYLSSIFKANYIKELEFLMGKYPSLTIDAVFCCSFSSDINERKIKESNMSFDNYFDQYTTEINVFFDKLIEFFGKCESLSCDKFWLCPLPINPLRVSNEELENFEKKIQVLNNIVTIKEFIIFDRLDIWKRRKDMLVNSNGHFSLHGIREILDSLARSFGQKHGRSFTSSIPMSSFPSMTFTNDMASSISLNTCTGSGGKWPKSSSNQYHPY